MTITIVGTFGAGAAGGTGSTLTTTLPTITTTSLGLVVATGAGTGSAFNTPTTQSWSAITNSPVSNGANYHCAAYVTNLSSSDSGATFTMTNGAPNAVRYAFAGIVLSGVTGIDANATPTNDITANTGVTIPSITPGVNDALMVALHGAQTSISGQVPNPWTASTGYTKRIELATNALGAVNVGAMVQTLQLTGQSGVSQTGATGGTTTGTARDVVFLVTIAPSGGAPPANQGGFLMF